MTSDDMVSMMMFHIASSMSLMEMTLANYPQIIPDISQAIDGAIDKSRNVNEHALWETYKDFMDPEINPSARTNVVPIIQ
tara:strand:- start:1224 stop:1463 length:240 start_codon:yes stop_codon:yes gene_type:complete